MKELNEKELDKVAGGYIYYDPVQKKYVIYDDNTGMLIGEYDNIKEALKVDAKFNSRTNQ